MLPLFIFYSDFNCLGSITDTVSKNDLYPAGLNTAWNSNEYLVHKLTTGSAETIKSLDSAGKCVSGTLTETSESNHHSISDPLYFNSGGDLLPKNTTKTVSFRTVYSEDSFGIEVRLIGTKKS